MCLICIFFSCNALNCQSLRENKFPFPLYSLIELLMSGGGKLRWLLTLRWIYILTVVDLSQAGLNSPAYRKSLSLFFALKHACSIPQGPPMMPEAVEKLRWTQAQFSPSTKPLHSYVYDKMSLTCLGFYFFPHGDIDLTCSYMQFVNIGILKRCIDKE